MNRFSKFRSLRSAFKQWCPKGKHTLPSNLPSPFFHTETINGVHEYFSACNVEMGSIPDSTRTLNGQCFVCRANVDFRIDLPPDEGPVNLRETLICPQCNMINRWRGCLHLFESFCKPTLQDRIYLTEMLSPVHQQLARRFPRLSASEYLPNAEFGSIVATHALPVRNEDVTQLTYDDCSFESVLCFDVLEHVPDYRAALREFFRVLSSGGQLILSVPFSFRQETLVRAELDKAGYVKHFVEPCYHGDPLSEQGVLSYYDFGMDLLDDMRKAGFQESKLLSYHSEEWGYLGANIAYVAMKS